MKVNEEIYSIRFNKAVLKDDIHFTTYTIDVPVVTALDLIIPKSIILKGNIITVTFSNKTKHILHYVEDVELFTREKEKEDGGNLQTEVKQKTVGRRKNPPKPRTA